MRVLHASPNCYFGDHTACLAKMEYNKRTEGKITTSKSVEENAFICRPLSLVCKLKHQGRMYFCTERLVNLHIFYQALMRPERIESSIVQGCHAISHNVLHKE